MPLDGSTSMETTIAGNGSEGSASNQLNRPWGIFVDTNFHLYVADAVNNRIPLFQAGQLDGVTVARHGIPNGLNLYFPTDVILDADGFLYIADSGHHRIIQSEHSKFQCIAGCRSKSRSVSDELNGSYAVRFDSYGNLYVADEFNHRIQKFILSKDSCHQLTTSEETIMNSLTSSNKLILDCSLPLIELIPSSLSLSKPLKFGQNQNINISSNIKLNCSKSLLIKTKWTISNSSNEIEFTKSIEILQNDIFIPSRTLLNGLYELKLTVTIINYPTLISSSSIYIEIISLNILPNLISSIKLMITHDYNENVIFNPGKYSIDPNKIEFNKNDWYYKYYCRIYLKENSQGFKLFENNFLDLWKYIDSINSSLIIFNKSLELNEIYQFMIEIINKQNTSIQSIGYLTVKIENITSSFIEINCVISTMCLSNGEYNYINLNTQISLYSICIGNCLIIENIQWNIYQGFINSTNQIIEWNLFNSIRSSVVLGLNTKNLTILKDFFIENNKTIYWRFQVLYSLKSEIITNIFDIEINQSPKYGSCSINPSNGTIITLFTINCSNWFDQDQIKDFIFYWTKDSSKRLMLGQTTESIFQVRLPSSIDETSTFHVIVNIRDIFDCITEFHLSPVTVFTDLLTISKFIHILQQPNSYLNDSIVQQLINGDKNIVGQVITSISQIFQEMNDETIKTAALNGISPTRISITSLNNQILNKVMNTSNDSVIMTVNEQLNQRANAREYLMMLINNLSITTVDDIKFQSSILSKLTQTTNELTRKTSIIASTKCHQLSNNLKSIATKRSYEDIYFIATHLAECATNVISGVNGPLQERGNILKLDLIRTKESLDNCDIDPECEWNNLNIFDDEDDSLFETQLKNQNIYYQKQTANKILNETTDIISSITSTFNIHSNINQSIIINTSAVYFSLEKLTYSSISNNIEMQFPSNINNTILLRKMIQPLALADHSQLLSYTNLSRSFSLSILDEHGNETKIKTNLIEFFIPRDPNIEIPSMFLQNVTLENKKYFLFNYHLVNLTKSNENLTYSITIEIDPLNKSLSYLLIYKFDNKPELNSMDGSKCFYPNGKDYKIYIHFINNSQTLNHSSIIYGIRELNTIEINQFCLNKTFKQNLSFLNEYFYFSSNYKIRIYQSSCFYLDLNNNWKSDGSFVGSQTNHYQTQCFSTHLTTFTSTLLFLTSSNKIYFQEMNNCTKNQMIYFISKLRYDIEYDKINQRLFNSTDLQYLTFSELFCTLN